MGLFSVFCAVDLGFGNAKFVACHPLGGSVACWLRIPYTRAVAVLVASVRAFFRSYHVAEQPAHVTLKWNQNCGCAARHVQEQEVVS